ncbi:hypothetical protein ACF3NR_10510 [Vaginella massiliensis]|uniref:hypothetical protein n=1 Tax=Vaginella massiliensis TaxID=1816680 RepID=UPI00083851FA|nr:hypothetical protein [Vaginella massiliensis]
MKRWLIITIAFLQLASTSQFSQLYKLPLFFSHYIEHSQNFWSISELKSFIVLHYGGHEMDDDWETDQKLPFMTVDRVHLDPCFVPDFQLSILEHNIEIYSQATVVWTDQFVPSSYLEAIWQPPKQPHIFA